jgi:hypothetical protein
MAPGKPALLGVAGIYNLNQKNLDKGAGVL